MLSLPESCFMYGFATEGCTGESLLSQAEKHQSSWYLELLLFKMQAWLAFPFVKARGEIVKNRNIKEGKLIENFH